MRGIKIFGAALIAAGVLGLAYGGFSHTRDTHEARIGPLEIAVQDERTVQIPVWAGVGAIFIGGLILIGPNRR